MNDHAGVTEEISNLSFGKSRSHVGKCPESRQEEAWRSGAQGSSPLLNGEAMFLREIHRLADAIARLDATLIDVLKGKRP